MAPVSGFRRPGRRSELASESKHPGGPALLGRRRRPTSSGEPVRGLAPSPLSPGEPVRGLARSLSWPPRLYPHVEPEVDDVAVADDVLLAFEVQLARRRGRPASVPRRIRSSHQITSALMKPRSKSVWMTPARLRRLAAPLDGPGATLVLAGGEEGDQVEQLVSGADHRVQARLLQPQRLEEGRPIRRVQRGDLRLDRRADHHHRRALPARRGRAAWRRAGPGLRLASCSSATLAT